MSTQPGPPPPKKGGLLILGIAIGAVVTLMLVILFLGLVWLGFGFYQSQRAPQVATPVAPPMARSAPLVPPPPRGAPAVSIESFPPQAAASSTAPVFHIRSSSQNLLDGKPFVLETPGEVRADPDHFLVVSDSPRLRISTALTVSLWFKVRYFNKPMALASRALNGPPWQYPYSSWLLRINNDQLLEASIAGSGNYSPSTWRVPDLQPGQWYHVVMTYDGHTKMLYLNGARQTQLNSGTLNHDRGIANTPGRAVIIGSDEGYENPTAELFDGAIDDVRLFNRALSDAEILELYGKSAKAGEGGGGNRLHE